MIKTQVQIPDHLFAEAKRIAAEYEMSFADVVRRGLEGAILAFPPRASGAAGRELPTLDLGLLLDPFSDADWRSALYMTAATVNEPGAKTARRRSVKLSSTSAGGSPRRESSDRLASCSCLAHCMKSPYGARSYRFTMIEPRATRGFRFGCRVRPLPVRAK